MKIIVGEIPDTGTLDVEFFEEARALNDLFGKGLESDFHFDSPVKGSFRISRQGKTVFVDLGLRGSIKVGCSRCLEKFDYLIMESCHLTLFPDEGEGGTETAIEEEAVDKSFYYGDSLNLEEILREETALSLPFNPTCREECKGLCSSCGKNLNEGDCTCHEKVVDIRFELLKEFKTQKK